MTKDYAKKRVKDSNYRSKRQMAHAQPFMPGWLWLILGVALGVGLAIFIFWKWGQQYQFRPAQPPIVITEEGSAPVQELAEDKDASSRFDFYTLLPDLKVEMPDVAAPPAARSNEKEVTQSGLAYILQAGSFRTEDQADKLKATLALSGFESHIQTVTIPPDETWYRVYIGPFTTKSEALVMQQNLKQSLASNSLILKIRV